MSGRCESIVAHLNTSHVLQITNEQEGFKVDYNNRGVCGYLRIALWGNRNDGKLLEDK